MSTENITKYIDNDLLKRMCEFSGNGLLIIIAGGVFVVAQEMSNTGSLAVPFAVGILVYGLIIIKTKGCKRLLAALAIGLVAIFWVSNAAQYTDGVAIIHDEQKGIVERIELAREAGVLDARILLEVYERNPDKQDIFDEATRDGASATQILNEVIKQNK